MHYSTLAFELQLPAQAVVFSPQSLYHKLRELTDLRGKQGRKYELAFILTLAILAKLCEQNQVRALAQWAALRLTQINTWFGLNLARLPHPTTWSRILANAVDPTELTGLVAEFFEQKQKQSAARSVTQLQTAERGSKLLVLDGKTLRGTIPAGQTHGVHLVAAYLPQTGLVLSQLTVFEKANEITVAPAVLAAVDLRGKVVAGDAMYAQKKLSGQIVAAGGDYLWLVKGNQKGVLSDIAILFEHTETATPGFSPYPTDFESYSTVSKGHGRLEERVITTSSMLVEYTPFPYLKQVFVVESRVTQLATGQTSLARRYGVSSLPRQVASPRRLLELVRGQWGIENRLHHRRDNTLREDWSQVRMGQAPAVLAVINNTVLSLLDGAGCTNAAEIRRQYAYNPVQALKLLV